MKKNIFSGLLLLICGVLFCDAWAIPFVVRPITLDRLKTPAGEWLPRLNFKEFLESKECSDLGLSDLDPFRKGEMHRAVFEAFWEKDFQNIEDPEKEECRRNKEIALDAGLCAIACYESGIAAQDGRAILPLLRLLNDFSFKNRPEISACIAHNPILGEKALKKKGSDLFSFSDLSSDLKSFKTVINQKRILDILYDKMQKQEPDFPFLKFLVHQFEHGDFRQNSPIPVLRLILNYKGPDLNDEDAEEEVVDLQMKAAVQGLRFERDENKLVLIEDKVLKFLKDPHDPLLKDAHFPCFLDFLLKAEEADYLRVRDYFQSPKTYPHLFSYAAFIINYYLKKVESVKGNKKQLFQQRALLSMKALDFNAAYYIENNMPRYGSDFKSVFLKLFPIEHQYAYAKIVHKMRYRGHFTDARGVLTSVFSMLSLEERKKYPEICLFMAEFWAKGIGGPQERGKALKIYKFLQSDCPQVLNFIADFEKRYQFACDLAKNEKFDDLVRGKYYKDLEYDAEGYYYLGLLYHSGKGGLTVDWDLSCKYLLKAVKRNSQHVEASFLIAQIYEKIGTPVQKRSALAIYDELQKKNYPGVEQYLIRIRNNLDLSAPEALLTSSRLKSHREALRRLTLRDPYFRQVYALSAFSDLDVFLESSYLHLADWKSCNNDLDHSAQFPDGLDKVKKSDLYAKAENSLKMLQGRQDALLHPTWSDSGSVHLYMTFFSNVVEMSIHRMFAIFYYTLIGIPDEPVLLCHLLKQYPTHSQMLSDSSMIVRFLYDGYQKSKAQNWLFSSKIYPYLHTDLNLEKFFDFKIPAVFSEAVVVIEQKGEAFSDWFLNVFLENGSHSFRQKKAYQAFTKRFSEEFAVPFQQAGKQEFLQRLFEITRGDVPAYDDLHFPDHPVCPEGYFYQMLSGVETFLGLHLEVPVGLPQIHLQQECKIGRSIRL